MSSCSLRDLAKLLRGVSLIVRNAAKRSQTLDDLDRGDLNAVIATSVKKSVVIAADISGLTKGVVHKCARSVSRERESSFYSSHSVSKHIPDEKANTGDAVQSIRKDSAVADSGNVELFSDLEASVSGDLPRVSTGSGGHYNFSLGNAVFNENNDNGGEICWDSGQEGRKKIGTTGVMRIPRERKVPSTAFSRAVGFAGLGVGLAWGTIQESVKRLAFGTSKLQEEQSSISPFLSEKNAERLAAGLCRMRGAALKIGQMFSIQDQSLIPPPILAALEIVRHGADMMPRRQLNHVLDVELGPEWSTQKLASFDYNPIAAASIGQVHRAVTKDGLQVAIKIQYPGVADSIESDIENVKLLLNYTNLIPKGLFLDNAMKVAKEELSRECNYELEAANQKCFRKLICNIDGFYVPAVIDDMSSKRILTTELVSGIPVDKVAFLNQGVRNYVGKKLLELTLMELFVFRFMQTDPNWSNFMFDEGSRVINLVDFGAAREYPKHFVDDYLGMVLACADGDREGVIEMSKRLGFLTGMESEVMIQAHVEAGFVVGMPFSKPGVYDFCSGEIARSITHLGATMLKYRQAPPPDEAYSLHRKLSGAFLTCIRLGSVIPCRDLLLRVCGIMNHTS